MSDKLQIQLLIHKVEDAIKICDEPILLALLKSILEDLKRMS